MEPATLAAIATAAVTIICSEALKQGGEKLGEAAYRQISQVTSVIREKFAVEQVEGKLLKAQEDPSDKNKSRLEKELVEKMEDDEAFARKLDKLIDELKAEERVIQIFFKDVKVKGEAEVSAVKQESTKENGSVNQEAITGVDVGGNLKIGNVEQRTS